jgi:hypothetical protein
MSMYMILTGAKFKKSAFGVPSKTKRLGEM